MNNRLTYKDGVVHLAMSLEERGELASRLGFVQGVLLGAKCCEDFDRDALGQAVNELEAAMRLLGFRQGSNDA
jgi:hypothetical protein